MADVDKCISCGTPIPEGYGMICTKCYTNAQVDRDETTQTQLTTYIQLLALERRQHAVTRRKLIKAAHDQERYARRIRLIQDENIMFRRVNKMLRKNLTQAYELAYSMLDQENPYALYCQLFGLLDSCERKVKQNGV